MARRGRKVNWDAKVKRLVGELRTALVEREKSRLEARVEAMVAGIGHGLETAKEGVRTVAAKVAGAVKAKVGRRKRGVYKRTAAQRKAQSAKMRAYWAAKRKGSRPKRTAAAARARKAKPGARPKAGSAWAAMTPEQPAARIEKMQAGRKGG